MFFREKKTTRFSEFIRNASAEEKKKLYSRVLKKATDDQLGTIDRASARQAACRSRSA
jgi:hypothetical protein